MVHVFASHPVPCQTIHILAPRRKQKHGLAAVLWGADWGTLIKTNRSTASWSSLRRGPSSLPGAPILILHVQAVCVCVCVSPGCLLYTHSPKVHFFVMDLWLIQGLCAFWDMQGNSVTLHWISDYSAWKNITANYSSTIYTHSLYLSRTNFQIIISIFSFHTSNLFLAGICSKCQGMSIKNTNMCHSQTSVNLSVSFHS